MASSDPAYERLGDKKLALPDVIAQSVGFMGPVFSSAFVIPLVVGVISASGKGGGVAHEDITVHEVSVSEVVPWLEAKAKTGVLIDPKVYAGLFFLNHDAKSF